ncbi:DUF2716 domain-containing protein [Arthrobacter sp. NEB 688]|uniref:DUF2716 domain-containing protein n=1 Tax=Arthrobacter sp. NEB 688 TaxID=904039 RepID=UPI001566A978|nr:DUF2716 domain-containing protein [Arthrobacter sp. NEB 688]QKE85102.1 DUF2716 domain-containing protein [Arthrobacter sp. NEB 688]
MSSPFAAGGIWTPLDYDIAWAPFKRFQFEANYHETSQPAITLPDGALVIDLSPLFTNEGQVFAAGEAAINASALRAFVSLAGDLEMTALDWQHTPYRYSPAKHALAHIEEWPVPVFPNGDYYIHLGPDAAWGTFGHPWQRSITLWGSGLTHSLGAELLTWLPRHPQSRA